MTPSGDDESDEVTALPDVERIKTALFSCAPTSDRFLKETAHVIHEATTYVLDGEPSLDELEACEKTYIGTKVEKRFLKHWGLPSKRKGVVHKLDTVIDGIDVDIKFSISAKGSWMIPPEARGKWCLLISMQWPTTYSIGLLKMESENLTKGANRDRKVSISSDGKSRIDWLGTNVPIQRL